MSVSLQTTWNEYTASGSTTVFPYTFKIVQAADLKVYQDSVLITTGFEINGIGVGGGGNITFITPEPPLVGTKIRLERFVPYTRSVDYISSGALDADVLDADIDRAVMMVQDLDRQTFKSAGGVFDLGGFAVTNVKDPTNLQDITTKNYVDTKLTQSGNVTAPANPADNSKFLQANAGVSSWVALNPSILNTAYGYTTANKAGDTFSGAVNFSGTYTSTGDGFGHPAANTISTYTNGVERLRVDNTATNFGGITGSRVNHDGDFLTKRTYAPTTGVYYFCDGTKYLYYNGTGFNLEGGYLTLNSQQVVNSKNTAKAWVRFNGWAGIAIYAAWNVSSITRTSTGQYTVYFTNAMNDGAYIVTSTGGTSNGLGGYFRTNAGGGFQTTYCALIHLNNSSNTYYDTDVGCLAFYGN